MSYAKTGTPLHFARCAFVNYLEDQLGVVAAEEREPGIMFGHEDSDSFIAGYLAALESNEP